LIRVPVGGIRFASRATKGVTIFSTAKDEKVVSVERINEPEDDEEIVDVVAGDGGVVAVEGDAPEADGPEAGAPETDAPEGDSAE
ncbi:MAG: DNA gyrase C-terminal beta-propeller domain-containing protein, partial [Rhizobium sp.]